MNLYCFILVVAFTASYAEYKYNFIRLCGYDLIAKQMTITFATRDDAANECTYTPSCIGVKKVAETEYLLLRTLRNLKPVAGCCDSLPEVYLYNRAFGIVMANAKSDMDVTLLYGIYLDSNCPPAFTNTDSVCIGEISADQCNAFAQFMEPSFDNGICTTLSKQTLVNKWA
uniref:Uncharacterized protein n=1 Tax=Panagrolaimus davidi TaxID=227884 RepID=A0A914PY09_9BILA